ncbi:FkbM family methyltransferase [Halopelagius fulvigenes]|uniref:FkbM family methyltransferase n=1 Tax=Halopelagius fulvigenes TaxID=1198324 RepID=A0ABD5U5L9_9EURY
MIDTFARLATALGVRPLAARGYGLAKGVEYRLHGETYAVEVGDAAAEFRIPTRNEFSDLDTLEERPVLEALLGELRPDDVFYDVGANVGLYSCLAADAVEPPVFAFEPHPENADRLAQNVAHNGANVSQYRYALAAEEGTAELALALDKVGSAGHSLVGTPGKSGYGRVEVRKRRGDELVESEGLPEPTVVKIDVEGAEHKVLDGLAETLSRPSCRLVYCEVHPEHLRMAGSSVADVRDRLEAFGFAVEDRSIRSGQPFLRGEK